MTASLEVTTEFLGKKPESHTRLSALKVATRGRFSKRLFDVIVALLLIVLFTPVIVICWLLLRQGGNPIFSQMRIGEGGHTFRVYKFRTMVSDAQGVLDDLLASNPDLRKEFERDHKLRDDPRITAVGAFLRKTSLDELPQLWNVLAGEMSVVGPRPIVVEEISRYGSRFRYYTAQKPGITGLWQVSGRNDVSYRRRVAMDAYYSRKHTLWMDCVIILDTIAVVLLSRGAY